MRHLCRTLLTLVVVSPVLVSADEWPWLRGTHLDGVSNETDLWAEWPDAGPPVLWTQPLGQGYSAFAISDGKAITHY